MISHSITVRLVTTREITLTVHEPDTEKAIAASEAAVISNPNLGYVVERTISCPKATAFTSPDPAKEFPGSTG